MIQAKIEVINKLGLHARAATKLANLTNRFGCKVSTGTEQPIVDAKSVMSLMLLAANQGTELIFQFDGEFPKGCIWQKKFLDQSIKKPDEILYEYAKICVKKGFMKPSDVVKTCDSIKNIDFDKYNKNYINPMYDSLIIDVKPRADTNISIAA